MQQISTIEKYCTLCHSKDLLPVGSGFTVTGDRVDMLRCTNCHSYVPDYFVEWEQSSLLDSQLELHEEMWKQESDEEYLTGCNELSALVCTLLESIEIEPGKRPRVLDLGAGRGWLSAAFKQSGCDVVGVDPSAYLMDKARRVFSMDEEYVNATASEYLDSCKDQFDVIVMWHVIEHIDRPLDTLMQARQKLAPGGIFALQTPLPLREHVFQEHLFFPFPSSFSFIASVLELTVHSIEIDPENAYAGCILGDEGTVESVPSESDFSMLINQYHHQLFSSHRLAEERLDSIEKMGREIFELEQSSDLLEHRLAEKTNLLEDEKKQRTASESLAEERLASMDKMGRQIYQLEQLCGEVEFRLKEEKHAIVHQKERIQTLRKDKKRILKNLAAAESMAKERYAAMQEMGDNIFKKSELIRARDIEIAEQAAEIEQYRISIEETRRFSYLLKLPYRRLRTLFTKKGDSEEDPQ